MAQLVQFVQGRLRNAWIQAAIAGVAVYIMSTRQMQPEIVRKLPAQLQSPPALGGLAAIAVLGINMYVLQRRLGTPMAAVAETVAPIVGGAASSLPFAESQLLSPDQF